MPCKSLTIHLTDDYIGMFYAYYSLIVYCIPFVYLTLMIRDRHILTWSCCGSHLVHELTTRYIKRLIGLPRPPDGPPPSGLFDGPYGMPSQHVACNSYMTTMLTLILFYHYRGYGNLKLKLLASLILLIGLLIQCQARVYLKYHDLRQVIGGLFHGSLSSLIYFILIERNILTLSRLCNWPVFRHFGFTSDYLSNLKFKDK